MAEARTSDCDTAVVGAGILGLAHAYHLARRGQRVIVFERDAQARGATIRNFGMLWPIGQPPGARYALARRSVELWREMLAAAGIWHACSGSLHVAYHDDEAAVLSELAAAAGAETNVELLSARQVLDRSPALRPEGLRAGLWSPTEVCVDPRLVGAQLWRHLARAHGVRFEFGCAATAWAMPRLLAGGREWTARRLLVCPGDDLHALFPAALAAAGLQRCKLQMLRSAAQPRGWRIGPMLAAGLTLRHYPAFAACPSLPVLAARLERELPEYVRLGIHVMVSQHRDELTLGDSHEYGDDALAPFDSTAIDELILRYLRGFFRAPSLDIVARWHGTYARHATEPYVVLRPAPGATIVTGVGGAGMTLSFGLAERIVAELLA